MESSSGHGLIGIAFATLKDNDRACSLYCYNQTTWLSKPLSIAFPSSLLIM